MTAPTISHPLPVHSHLSPIVPTTIPSPLKTLAKAIAQLILTCFSFIAATFTCFALPCIAGYYEESKKAYLTAWAAFRDSLRSQISAPIPAIGSAQPAPIPAIGSAQPVQVAAPAAALIPLTAEQREHRVRQGAENIAGRLQREWQAAQTQMIDEGNKTFLYRDGAGDQRVHQERLWAVPMQVGVASTIGGRDYMEDRYLVQGFRFENQQQILLGQTFAVFDGHGGSEAATFAQKYFLYFFLQELRHFNPERVSDEGIWNALKMSLVNLNERFKLNHPNDLSGCTASIAIQLNGKLWCANVGDSRTVLDNDGTPQQLSEDAKPNNPRYQQSIVHRGGLVFGNRIGGNLAVGRALGDRSVIGVSARPKITMIPMDQIPQGGHLIIASDGFWDVTSSRQAVSAVHDHRDTEPPTLARNLVYSALEAGTSDNTTVMVVKILRYLHIGSE